MWVTPAVEKLKMKRLEKGLSQHQLSIKAGLGGSAICRIEGKETKKIHPLRAQEIAKVLGCDVHEIFNKKEQK